VADAMIEAENYAYWDKFKHYTFPDDTKPEEAWAVLKISRLQKELTLQRHLISRTLLVLAFVELIHLGSPLTFSDCYGIHVPRLWRG
jgi:hypothetical protein